MFHLQFSSDSEHFFVLRLCTMLVKTAIAQISHRILERSVHAGTHKLGILRRATKRFGIIPDILMFVGLLAWHCIDSAE